jgi:hypothetical protein
VKGLTINEGQRYTPLCVDVPYDARLNSWHVLAVMFKECLQWELRKLSNIVIVD